MGDSLCDTRETAVTRETARETAMRIVNSEAMWV